MNRVVFLFLFSFVSLTVCGQTLRQICDSTNRVCRDMSTAYYTAEIIKCENGKSDTLSHEVYFRKNGRWSRMPLKINMSIFRNGSKFRQIIGNKKNLTIVKIRENLAEQYLREDYKRIVPMLNKNILPEFARIKDVFRLNDKKIKTFKLSDTVICGDKCYTVKTESIENNEDIMTTTTQLHYIRQKDYMPMRKDMKIRSVDMEDKVVDEKRYVINVQSVEPNIAIHTNKFIFNDKNSLFNLRHKSYSALKREWEKQEKKQSSFAYGTAVQDFVITDIDNRKIDTKELYGNVYVLFFFYNQCSPCLMVMKDLEQLYREYGQQGFEVVAINPVDKDLTTEQMHSFVKDIGVSFDVCHVTDRQLEQMYLVRYYPTIFVVNRKGRIVYSHQGYNSLFKREIEDVILKCL